MKKILLMLAVLAAGNKLTAQTYSPISLTGFNADVIANGSGLAGLSTTQAVDIANFSLMAQGFVNPSNQSPTSALPSNGLINSVATSGLSFQLAPFTGNNALRIPASGTTTGTGTGTLTLSTPVAADKLYVLALSGNGNSTVTITVNFTDATNQVFAAQVVNDWFGGTGFAIQGIGRVNRSTNVIENPANDPKIYQKELVLSAANKVKLIQSIAFNKTSTTGVLNVFGVSRQAAGSTLAVDAGVTAITTPTTACNLTNQETVTISVTNFGSTAQSNIPVSYTLNGGTPVNEVMAGPLAANTTANYTFTTKANLAAPATYTIVARTTITGDLLATNDSFSKTVVNNGATATPTISAAGSTALCPGGSVVLTASTTTSNATYAWFINGAAIPNATSPTFNANAVGNYTVTASAAGCQATSQPTSVTVNPTPATPTISRTGNVLTSNTATGNQWYRNNTIITGATGQTHTLTSNGSYTVTTTVNGCSSAASQAIVVSNITGINEAESLNLIVSPNPSVGLFHLELPTTKMAELVVTDLAGRIILKETIAGNQADLNLGKEAKGIYLLKISSQEKTAIRKLILE